MVQPSATPSTLSFAPGERVLIRDEEWIVRGTTRTLTGAIAVKVSGLSELVRAKDAVFLSDIDDIEPLRAEDTRLVADDSPRYRRARLYLESLLRKTPPTDDRLHIGHRGAIDATRYQLVPAQRALARVRPRLLIADGVGLGKTIEVGILLSELIRRGRGQRILVVALKSILEQFQRELWGRFAIPVVRLDSDGIQRVRTQIPSNMNPFHHFDRVIISIDTLKRDEKYAAFLEQAQWDAVVIDECQNVALRGSAASKRRKLAERLAHTADALILTSATPHDGTAKSLASIVKLLEPTAIANEEDFSYEEIKDLFIRRFKRDVDDEANSSFFERKTELVRVPASPDEESALAQLSKASFRTINTNQASSGALFRTTLLKAFLSSPEACLETISARKRRLEATNDKRKVKLEAADIDADLELLNELEAGVAKVTPKTSSKLACLFSRLEALGYSKGQSGDRVVIFSERIRTLKMLQAALKSRFGLSAEQAPIFHGQMRDVDQQRLVKAFGTEDAPVRIFLASDAASEGINLHFFCHRMIHFDVPWSLITLEQRNGRIDRFGQVAEPDIRYLLLEPSDPDLKGDLRVLERLIDKEKEAHRNLGDAALLMKAYDADKEVERVAQAVERKISPEQAVPDVDSLFGDDDPLLALLNGGSTVSDPDDGPSTATTPSLFADDLAYAELAFAELRRDDPSLAKPEMYEEPRGFLLRPPDDLRVRFRHLPPELQPQAGGELFLTVDRDQVQRSLAEARQKQDRFQEWSLFWPLHPVAEWMDDRLLAHFGRHEAPVLEVSALPGEAQVALIFQGIISNRRSQPVSVEWFGVGYDTSAELTAITPLSELILSAGLNQPLTNPSAPRDVQALSGLVPLAVEQAYLHLEACRRKRSDELVGPLKTELKRLRTWFAKMDPSARQFDFFEAPQAAKDRKINVKQEQAFEQAKKAKAAYERYVEDVLKTVEQPSLRLAAVLIRRTP